MAEVILIIDDDPLLLATLAEVLTSDGTTAIQARTGTDALQQMQGGMPPDVVIIDLDMRDGYAILAQLECAMENAVPVVALSSAPRRLFQAGIVDAVLMKPFEVEELRTRVHRVCEEPRGAS